MTSCIGTLTVVFLGLEWWYTPVFGERDTLRTPAEADLASELVPYMMFGLPPGTAMDQVWMPAVKNDATQAEFTINRHGFRYREISRYKPSQTLRIVMVGGSVVLYGHTNETTISGYVEKLIKSRYSDQNVEVINAGVTGFISDQELILLVLKLTDYQPDFVIVFDGFNDFLVPTSLETRLGYPFKFKALELSWYNSTKILRHLLDLPFTAHATAGSHFLRRLNPHWSYLTHLENLAMEKDRGDIAAPPTPQDIAAHLAANWEKMATFLESRHCGAMLILQPFNQEGIEYQEHYDAMETHIQALQNRFAQSKTRRFLSYRHLMDNHRELFYDMIHTYDQGNELYAQQMWQDLQNLLPLSSPEP
jgi:lysophospholipase L1-like esterase